MASDRSSGTRFRQLEDAWQAAADRLLPVVQPGAPWRSSGAVPLDLPYQGWKLHVSATVMTAVDVLQAVGPVLHRRGVLFKGPATLLQLKQLNCGLFHGFSQVGKFLTVYPPTEELACTLALELDTATRGAAAPAVPFERAVSSGSSVFTRYGAFRDDSEGRTGHLRTPDGDLVEDRRDHDPPWAALPEGLIRATPSEDTSPGPLSTTFRAFSALGQRGKGGVYQAVDLSASPARPCVVKEGRALGEVDWDGSDGRSRIRHEGDVLTDLSSRGVDVPELYARFEQGGHAYLVLEWVDGRPLSDVVSPAAELLPLDTALDLGRQCAALVRRIHECGWIWRDLKTANLVLTPGNVLRPLDFEGAARPGVRASPWGTAGYLPKGWTQSSEVSASQDLYALGVVLSQLLTNAAPVADEAPPPVRSRRADVPERVAAVVDELTRPAAAPARTPDRSAKIVQRELAAALRRS
ncbi:MAG: protein kinase [Propionibacteriales bacterium]|nr:protein kinase [Propionibacteriales bacterium]